MVRGGWGRGQEAVTDRSWTRMLGLLGLQDCVVEDRCPHLLLLISISILGSSREDGYSVQPAQARQVILSSLVLNKINKE